MEVEAEIFEKYGDPYTLLPGMQAITEEEEFRQHDQKEINEATDASALANQ